MRDLVFGLSRQNVKKLSLAPLSIDVDWLFSIRNFYSSIKFPHILMISAVLMVIILIHNANQNKVHAVRTTTRTLVEETWLL